MNPQVAEFDSVHNQFKTAEVFSDIEKTKLLSALKNAIDSIQDSIGADQYKKFDEAIDKLIEEAATGFVPDQQILRLAGKIKQEGGSNSSLDKINEYIDSRTQLNVAGLIRASQESAAIATGDVQLVMALNSGDLTDLTEAQIELLSKASEQTEILKSLFNSMHEQYKDVGLDLSQVINDLHTGVIDSNTALTKALLEMNDNVKVSSDVMADFKQSVENVQSSDTKSIAERIKETNSERLMKDGLEGLNKKLDGISLRDDILSKFEKARTADDVGAATVDSVFDALDKASEKGGRLGKFIDKAKYVAGPLAVTGVAGYNAWNTIDKTDEKLQKGQISQDEGREDKATAVGGLAGAGSLAAIGAGVGTAVLPGVGTAVGGLIGAGIGGLAGYFSGGWVGKKLAQGYNYFAGDKVKEKEKPRNLTESENRAVDAAMANAFRFSPQDPIGKEVAPNVHRTATGDVGGLLEFIGNKESKGNYNALVYGKNTPKSAPLTDMTLAQVDQYQQGMISQGHASSAVGKYQFIRPTLRETSNALGLKPETKFTPEIQDKLAIQLLKRRGLDKYVNGYLSQDKFAYNLALEWASMPTKSGKSAYEGLAGNTAGATYDQLVKAISGLTGSTMGSYSAPTQVASANTSMNSQAESLRKQGVPNDIIKMKTGVEQIAATPADPGTTQSNSAIKIAAAPIEKKDAAVDSVIRLPKQQPTQTVAQLTTVINHNSAYDASLMIHNL